MSAVRTVLPQMRRMGVEVVTDIELGDYGRLLRRDFKVIILMAHWSGRTVEFADGFAEVPAILDQFPPGIVRLFDLSICHPEPLAMAMRLRLPDDCLIRYGTSGATPALWLYFYLSLFHQLRNNKLSYLQAFELNMETWRASHDAGAI